MESKNNPEMNTESSTSKAKSALPLGTSSSDTIKRLIHTAAVLVKQLDGVVAKAKVCRDVFTPEAIELRAQLSHLCAKSITADPIQCRRRAEELLWKKCFYDVISFAKQIFKKSPPSFTDKFYLGNHIDMGIAKFTEHLQDVCARLEKLEPPTKLVLNIFPIQTLLVSQFETNEPREDLLESVQRVLIWLGDLSRYSCDLGISNIKNTAQRLYQQAIIVNPSNGLAFNQLGTVASHDSTRSFESMFYYMRSLKAQKVFPGAGPNLKTLLLRLASNEDALVSSFSQLLSSLVLDHKQDNPFELGQLCQMTLAEIQKRLQEEGANLTPLLDLAAAAMLCAGIRESNSHQSTAATAFCCSLFSHILSRYHVWFNLDAGQQPQQLTQPTVVSAVEGEISASDDDGEDEVEETKRARMRRRKIAGSASSDQELSDEELSLSDSSDDDADLETDSEDDQVLSDSGFHSSEAKIDQLLILSPSSEALLPLLKSMTDWFRSRPHIVRVSSPSVRQMWADLAKVLNVLKCCQRENIPELYRCSPLEEDWKTYGISDNTLDSSQMIFDGSAPAPPTTSLASAMRIEKILAFGTWLTEQEGLGFSCDNGKFFCPPVQDPSTHSDAQSEELLDKKNDLMGKMAHLWLKSEVQELESKLSPKTVRRKNKKLMQTQTGLSRLPFVFVIPDVAALTKSTQLIKQIVKSQKLIVIIPDVVISEMDLLKKENSCVRECIKWLESCFKNGNRFIRAQRPNEHQAIPLFAYPKRKDKSAWTIFQILECCHYLDTYQRQAHKNLPNAPIVLFLTGNSEDDVDQQTRGICSSIGVELQTTKTLLQRKLKPKKC